MQSATVTDSPGSTVYQAGRDIVVTAPAERRRVDVRVEFEPQSPNIILTPIGSDTEQFLWYLFRVNIRNNSASLTARHTYLKLTELLHEKDGQYIPEARFEPLRLGWDDTHTDDINPQAEVLAPFGRVAHISYQLKYDARLYSDDPNQPQFRFLAASYPR